MTQDVVELDALAAGDDVATDAVASRRYQQIKIVDGTIDSVTPAAVGNGVETNALRVTVASDSTGVLTANPASGTIDTVTAVTDITNPITANPASGTIDTVTTVGTVTNDVGIVGAAAENAVASGNPVLSGGRYDATPRVLGDTDVGAIALDADGAVHISDGGNTITVGGTVTASGPVTDTELRATPVEVDLGTNNDVTVAGVATAANQLPDGHNVTVDNASIAVTNAGLTELAAAINTSQLDVNIATDSVGIGGGTQYTEDAVAATDPVGNAQILIRDDAPVSIAADGDNVAQRGTAYGAAYTQLVDSSGNFIDTFAGSGGTNTVDDADFVAGTTAGTIAQGVYESSPTSVTDGDVGAIGITATREIKVDITSNSAGVGGGVSYTEDEVAANPIVGTATMIERDDVLTATPIEGDWMALKGSAEGALWTQDFNSDAILADTSSIDGKITVGAGTEAAAVRVTLPTDGTGVVTETNSAGILADTAAIDTATAAINAKLVTGTVIGAVEISDTSFAVADGNALGEGVLIQGDDGTDRKNINVDATTGDVQVDVTNTVTVDLGANNDVTVAGVATAANQIAKATGGCSFDMLAMAAEDNDKVIKGSAGTIYWISAQSIDATPVYLKLFNAASITPGTTSADLQFLIPSQGDANGAGLVLNFGTHGIEFGTGICALVSTGIGLTANTAVSANEVIVTIGYE